MGYSLVDETLIFSLQRVRIETCRITFWRNSCSRIKRRCWSTNCDLLNKKKKRASYAHNSVWEVWIDFVLLSFADRNTRIEIPTGFRLISTVIRITCCMATFLNTMLILEWIYLFSLDRHVLLCRGNLPLVPWTCAQTDSLIKSC